MGYPESLTLPPEQLARWSLDEYRAFVDSGALNGRRVELIAGQIVEMSPVNNPHEAGVSILTYDFGELLPSGYRVRAEKGVALPGEASVPQPDIAVVRFREDYYAFGKPTPDDITLLVEVADSSLDYDRQVKAPIYERAGIREYWIINLQDRQLERYVLPQGVQTYGAPEVLPEGKSLYHELLGNLAVEDLLPMTKPAS